MDGLDTLDGLVEDSGEGVSEEEEGGGSVPWWINPWSGWGRGFGWRWWWRVTGLPGWMRWGYPEFGYPPYTYQPEDELRFLEAMREDLEAELEDIKKRIEELKKEIEK